MKIRRIVATGLALVLAALVSVSALEAAAKPAPSAKVNLNTASAEQLATLPGVGEKLAARIVEHRQKAGGFKSIQELMNVRGIAEKNFQKIETYLTVGEARPAR
jgi:competence protein ComEA